MATTSPIVETSAGFSCVEVGTGPPLVLLPGMARKPVRNRLPYRALARITNRTVHVVNRPVGLRRGITMPELAAMHAQFLAEHFAEPVDLIGVSTGGAIALQLAVDHPQRVNRLIIAAAAAWLGDEGRGKLRAYGDAVQQGRSGATILASVLASPAWEGLVSRLIWLSDLLENGTSPDDMLATIDAEVGFDARDKLGQMRIPSLFIAGGRDRAFPIAIVEDTAAGVPGSKLIVYPNAGHIGAMANRRFGPDIAAFLTSPAPASV